MMNKAPSRWELPALIDHVKHGGIQAGVKVGGMTVWVPARPEGFFSLGSRFRLALAVFRGEADALFWPQDQ